MKIPTPLRLALLAIAAILTAAVLLYVWADWRGARHWAETKATLEAVGEPLTLEAITPDPIPDELNFAAAPIFAELFEKPREEWRIAAIPTYLGAYQKGSSAVANYARAIDPEFSGSDEQAARLVLADAAQYDPLWAEIRAATNRRGIAWPFEPLFESPPRLDHIGAFLSLAQTLSARARANLELGNSEAALSDLALSINLSDRIGRTHLLITQFVRLSTLAIALSDLDLGIAMGAWTPDQIVQAKQLLAGINLPDELRAALRGDRVFALQQLDSIENAALLLEDEPPHPAERKLLSLVPPGVPAAFRADYLLFLQHIIDRLPDSRQLPAALEEWRDEHAPWGRFPFGSLATQITELAAPAILSAAQRTLHLQTRLALTTAALEIERYRQTHGQLPDSLSNLPPTPPDPLTGEPLIYRPTGPDSFLLYGVGWNQQDDNGSRKKPSPKAITKAEDWVWNAD